MSSKFTLNRAKNYALSRLQYQLLQGEAMEPHKNAHNWYPAPIQAI